MSALQDIFQFIMLAALLVFPLVETLLRLIWFQPTLVTFVANWLLTLILILNIYLLHFKSHEAI